MDRASKKNLKHIAIWVLFIMLPLLLVPLITGDDLGVFLSDHIAVGCFALSCVFAYFAGSVEGWLYYYMNASTIKKELHPQLTVMRLIVWLLIGLYCESWLVPIICIFAFPFIHDGKYYITRNKISEVYPKGWFAQSKTSTAYLTKVFTPLVRTLCFVASIAGLVIYEIYLK